jgi:uncharacterized metal-binding protein YceD (DUF177 family)
LQLNSKQKKALRKQYELPFTGLKEGVHSFEFPLDQAFFKAMFTGMEEYDNPEDIESGEALLSISLEKKPHFMVLDLLIEGSVNVPCNTCLEPAKTPISIDQKVIVTQDEEKDGTENYLVLDSTDVAIDLLPLIYENLNLAIPIRHVHDEGQCDPTMKQYISDDTEAPEESSEADIDPRWAKLADLKKDKKKNK